MSPVWSFVCGPHPTLSPSSQVPLTLDLARLGLCHTHCHPGGFSIGSTCLPSHQPPVSTTQLLRVEPASLVLALGYFDELHKHVLGGTGWSVAMDQLLGKPLYVFDLDMEQWHWWNPTLQHYQPCQGMTEEQIALPTLQGHTAIVGTREEDKAVYPTLDALFKRT